MYISLSDNGIDSTLPFIHEGHTSIATCNSKNDAHQKHEPHNKKCVSLHIFITLMLFMILKHLQLCCFEDNVIEIYYITLISDTCIAIRVYLITSSYISIKGGCPTGMIHTS